MREMKDSGISWINEIPVYWNVEKIKHHAIKIERGTSPEYTDEPITKVVNQATFSKGFFDRSNIRFSSKPADTSRGLLEIHDVLVASTGGGVLGKTHLFQEEDTYVADGHVTIIRTNQSELNSAYLRYFLGVNYETINAVLAVGSTNQTELQRDLLANMFIPYPPLAEQKRIAAFLDGKCAEIDALVADIQSQIDTLEQYKRSVITETVTKGLNPDVEMKDSGIEWVGMIPNTWTTCRFKDIAWVKSNLVEPTGYEEYPQISPENIEKNSGRLLKYNTVEDSGIISGNHLFFKGQILYSKIRPNLNKVAIAPCDGLCSADMYPIETSQNVKFLLYLMLSQCFVEQVSVVIRDRVKMPKINQDELGQIRTVIPSIMEQNEIADYLDERCTEIDTIIDQKKEQLSVLDSYKKSLIYEYVTGKKEVPAQ